MHECIYDLGFHFQPKRIAISSLMLSGFWFSLLHFSMVIVIILALSFEKLYTEQKDKELAIIACTKSWRDLWHFAAWPLAAISDLYFRWLCTLHSKMGLLLALQPKYRCHLLLNFRLLIIHDTHTRIFMYIIIYIYVFIWLYICFSMKYLMNYQLRYKCNTFRCVSTY